MDVKRRAYKFSILIIMILFITGCPAGGDGDLSLAPNAPIDLISTATSSVSINLT